MTKLQAWKTQSPFDKAVPFLERLLADGLIEEELLILTGESAESG